MIRGLVLGVLLKDPERKTAASGTDYCKAMLRVDCKALREGDPQHIVAFVTAFGSEAEALAAKRKGDSVAVAGRLDIRAGMYQDAPQASVSVTVDRLIDATRPPRKKKEAAPGTPLFDAARRVPSQHSGPGIEGLDEDLPF